MGRKPTIGRIEGYGGYLRGRLSEVGATQSDLIRAAGVSRQTVVNALRDRLSDRTKRIVEAALDKLSTSSRPSVSTPPKTSELLSPLRATATQLTAWSDRRDSQADLPRLVRRLVLASAQNARIDGFRGGEGIQLAGEDGYVESEVGSTFVPAGVSRWELSTKRVVRAKADADFEKRLANPKETFVFVTSRRWPDKHLWVQQQRSRSVWHDVRALDADDLETWLEQFPSVHLWFSIQIGVAQSGATDLGHWWQTWKSMTKPSLGPQVLLAGREDGREALVNWYEQGRRDSLAIKSESRVESIAVLAAVYEQLGGSRGIEAFGRTVVVDDLPSWRALTQSRQPLVLVPLFEIGDALAEAAQGGHSTVLPLGAGDTTTGAAVILPEIARVPAAAALEAEGNVDSESAWQLAALGRRSLIALRRELAIQPGLKAPEWSRPSNVRQVLPALFAGSWDDAHVGDRAAIAQLGQRSYDEIVESLLPWVSESDPPVRRRGSVWYLVSRDDAWILLRRHLLADDFLRFEKVAVEILGTLGGEWDLPPGERWMSNLLLPPSHHSGRLREAIADSLALMGTLSDEERFASASLTPSWVAKRVVRQILERAKGDAKRWMSLGDCLPSLAEAAPDVFLGALEADLNSESPELGAVFTDKQPTGLFASSPHIGLLRALERLAWSPDYLSRAVRVLGRLNVIDPGGMFANRPHATLRSIFLPWLPQTAASVEQRITVLDQWTDAAPEEAWKTLVTMLPEFHGSGSYSSKPRWRDWAPDKVAPPPGVDRLRATSYAVGKLLQLAQKDGGKWAALIESLATLPQGEHEQVVAHLEALQVESLSSGSRAAIWNALREFIAKHRSFSEARWALPPDRLAKLESTADRFVPTEATEQFGWLFAPGVRLPDARTHYSDYVAYAGEVESRQDRAIEVVSERRGIDGIVELARVSQDPGAVGRAWARSPRAASSLVETLKRFLASDEQKLDHFAYGLLVGHALKLGSTVGKDWITGLFTDRDPSWLPRKRAQLLLALDPEPETWILASSAGEQLENEYWQQIRLHRIDPADISEAAMKLMHFQRPIAAVELLGQHASNVSLDASLILNVLEASLEFIDSESATTGMSYAVERLLDALETKSTIDEVRVARLEWQLLPIISRYDRSPKVLGQALVRNAALFAELISLVYRSSSEPDEEGTPEVKKSAASRASRGYALLRSLSVLPGTQSDGTVDATAMLSWISDVQARLAVADRLQTGMHEVGQLLGSRASRGSDGLWPIEPVRQAVETFADESMKQGMSIGAYNSRGVFARSMESGGEPELKASEEYLRQAKALAIRWPQTAEVLRSLAQSYAADGLREAEQMALREDMGI